MHWGPAFRLSRSPRTLPGGNEATFPGTVVHMDIMAKLIVAGDWYATTDYLDVALAPIARARFKTILYVGDLSVLFPNWEDFTLELLV